MYEGKNSIAFFWPNKWAHLLKSNNINGGGSSKSEKKKKDYKKAHSGLYFSRGCYP
jgi:hypothetical protein